MTNVMMPLFSVVPVTIVVVVLTIVTMIIVNGLGAFLSDNNHGVDGCSKTVMDSDARMLSLEGLLCEAKPCWGEFVLAAR